MPPAHFSRLAHRSLISLSGRDTFKYLQALTTNNLAKPSSQFTSFLNAQGRVLYDAFLYKTADDACLVEVDSNVVENLIAHLARYKLRSKFAIRKVEAEELSVFSIWELLQDPSTISTENLILQTDCRGPSFGHRLLSSPEAVRGFDLGQELQEQEVKAYTRRRYQYGIAEGPNEILYEKALPMESNIDYMKGLDFHKGCYLGQELTVRTHHTGIIRKRLMPVKLERDDTGGQQSESSPSSDTWIADPEDKVEIVMSQAAESTVRSRPAGRLLGMVGDLGLALCRLEKVQSGSRGTVTIAGRKFVAQPFRPEHWPSNAESVR